MSTVFFLIAAFSYLLRVECFEFYVARDLTSTKELPEKFWSHFQILGIEDPQNKDIKVKVTIPTALSYSGVSIFFANDIKQILKVQMNVGLGVKGTFYSKPHKLENEMTAGDTDSSHTEDYAYISGSFPRSWLPTNSTKISATVTSTDGKYYNYYGIQNSVLSITDLMVVEEFKQLTS